MKLLICSFFWFVLFTTKMLQKTQVRVMRSLKIVRVLSQTTTKNNSRLQKNMDDICTSPLVDDF